MEQNAPFSAARGITDEHNRLLSADQALAELHERCGGSVPGTLAVPELLHYIKRSRQMNLRLAREFKAFDGEAMVSGFVKIDPLSDAAGGGCELLVDNLQRTPVAQEDDHDAAMREDAIDRSAVEVSLRLGPEQRVQWVSDAAPDAKNLVDAIDADPGKHWTEYVVLDGMSYQKPLHWRLLDGARCSLPGSDRGWRVRLFANGPNADQPDWFELLLIPDQALSEGAQGQETRSLEAVSHSSMIGSALTPALRQPVARIVASAETIKSRLAGPLRKEYSEYAGNIAAAGQHLTAMLEDLADLEVVEAPGFSTTKEEIDLGDVVRRAAGILGVRARERRIELILPKKEDRVLATAEFRRALQILLNLVGNALSYSPEDSSVTISLSGVQAEQVAIVVKDQGPGVTREQADRIFQKFERLGREDKSGSGLGLYISRRLALAMGGDLVVSQGVENGAEFKLTLPAA